MKKVCLILGLTMAVNGASGESFEAPEQVAGEAVKGSWASTGDVQVSSEESQGGDQSVKIGAGELSANVDGQGVRFVDFQILPSFGDNGTEVEVAGAKLKFFVENGAGKVSVEGSTGGTRVLEQSYPVAQGNVATAWLRVSLRVDSTKNTVDVYLDGKPLKANIPTDGTNAFVVRNGEFPAAYLDEWLVSSENPLFEDQDRDGMADAEEIARGLNPFIDDRDADVDGNGVSNIEDYFSSTGTSGVSGSGHVLYVDNLNGNDANTGKYSYAAMGQNGPKSSLTAAMNTAPDGGMIIILRGTGVYEESSRSAEGKSLTITALESVTIK